MSDEAYDHVDPYGDGTYGTNNTPASTELEHDQHEEFSRQQSVVMAMAMVAGYYGITGADVKEVTGWDSNVKSRSLSNILRDGQLVRLKERRDRAHVHVLPKWVMLRDVLPYESTNTKHRLAALREARNLVAGSLSYDAALMAIDELIRAEES